MFALCEEEVWKENFKLLFAGIILIMLMLYFNFNNFISRCVN